MAEQGAASGQKVFRTPGSVVLWWAWLVIAVIILASVLVRGHNHTGVVTALVALTITGFMYACALQPRIVADGHGITVQNPLRWHMLPWAVVTKVDLVQTVEVHHTGTPGEPREKVVHSWAVQSSAASRTRADLRARHSARTAARTGPRTATSYGQSPGAARQPPAAQLIARQLNERVTAEHQRATAAAEQAAPGQAAPGQQAEVRWAWWQIAAIVVPLLALVIVAAT